MYINRNVIMLFIFWGRFFCATETFRSGEPQSSRCCVAIVGSVDTAGSIARESLLFAQEYVDSFDVSIVPTQFVERVDYDNKIRQLIKRNCQWCDIAILTDIISWPAAQNYLRMPPSRIKIAYSMLESSRIPEEWTQVLNKYFDAVMVPDEWLVNVYKQCGVTIPIFVLPSIVELDDFLNRPVRNQLENSFTFGCCAVNWPRKNLSLLIKGFHEAFCGNDKVKLVLHIKGMCSGGELKKLIKDLNSTNIIILEKALPREQYVQLFSTFDCYVLLSRGEGFSVTPREALALGIPCILSKNTAHTLLCKNGVARAVPSNILHEAYYSVFRKNCGVDFDCTLSDVVQALKDVYEHYDFYKAQALRGREWVKQYLPNNLKQRYINIVAPQKILFGLRNEVTEEYLMTDDQRLFNKYCDLLYKMQEASKSCMTFTPKETFRVVNFEQSFNSKSLGVALLDRDARFRFSRMYDLYELGMLRCKDDSLSKIPHIIHQIWLGGECPKSYASLIDSWQKLHPGWQYKLWTDADVSKINMVNKKFFDDSKNLGEKSDIMRYEVLNQYGGVYTDVDVLCLRPLDELCSKCTFCVGVEHMSASVSLAGNAIIACAAGHPVIKKIIELMAKFRGKGSVPQRTGPWLLTTALIDLPLEQLKGVLVLPPSYFYPRGRGAAFKKLLPMDYIRDETLAVHYWDGVWMK